MIAEFESYEGRKILIVNQYIFRASDRDDVVEFFMPGNYEPMLLKHTYEEVKQTLTKGVANG